MKKNLGIGVAILCIVTVQSCKQSPTAFATKWTADMKASIMKNANQNPDKTVVDSFHKEITLFKNDKKLRQYYYIEKLGQEDVPAEKKMYDTSMIIYYSADQNFQFVQNPCVNRVYRSYECVAYKGDAYGFVKYKLCGLDTVQTGFQFKNQNVGPWTKFDKAGKETDLTETGNDDFLLKIKDLK